ncbi:hypothetical protein [Zoogloea sp.]|uniref:hypothetical protein n=1 Tax=Zoogloea sp. TaxID=49181 RepID=UPI0031FE40FE
MPSPLKALPLRPLTLPSPLKALLPLRPLKPSPKRRSNLLSGKKANLRVGFFYACWTPKEKSPDMSGDFFQAD